LYYRWNSAIPHRRASGLYKTYFSTAKGSTLGSSGKVGLNKNQKYKYVVVLIQLYIQMLALEKQQNY